MAEAEWGDVYTWLRARGPIRWLLSKRGAWLIAILVGATSFLIINGTTGNLLGAQVAADYRLATQGRTTLGTVTGLQPSDHAGCSFTWRVAGQTFSGYQEGCGAGNQLGSPIKITYLPSSPHVGTTGHPVSEFWWGLLFSYGAPLSLALMMYFGWKRFAKEQKAKPPLGTA